MARNLIDRILLRIALIRMVWTEADIVQINTFPAQKSFHLPMDKLHILYFTQAASNHRLVGHNDCQIARSVDFTDGFYRTGLQFKLLLLIDKSVLPVESTIPVQKDSPLLLTQAASADKSAGQFIFSLLDALHGANIFDVLRRVITMERNLYI